MHIRSTNVLSQPGGAGHFVQYTEFREKTFSPLEGLCTKYREKSLKVGENWKWSIFSTKEQIILRNCMSKENCLWNKKSCPTNVVGQRNFKKIAVEIWISRAFQVLVYSCSTAFFKLSSCILHRRVTKTQMWTVNPTQCSVCSCCRVC